MAKQLIAIRLSPRLLDQLRKMAAKQGKPYQTLIHELLERAASQPQIACGLGARAIRGDREADAMSHLT
jgi:hypothetical protein